MVQICYAYNVFSNAGHTEGMLESCVLEEDHSKCKIFTWGQLSDLIFENWYLHMYIAM